MSVTIHYRGTMDDVGLIDEFEDRVVDLTFALGGKATLWRSYADHDRTRMIRGLIVEMAPGQESLTLLVAPEGHLINLFEIEDAEKHPVTEPSDCFVKTQFGSPLGHVAIVCLLDAMQEQYFSNLVVNDESGFFDHRDYGKLKSKLEQLGGLISGMASELREYGMSPEAAEDPDILASRIERVAKLVQQKMNGQSAPQEPTSAGIDGDWGETTLENDVAKMESIHRNNERRTEKIIQQIFAAQADGKSTQEAFEIAMNKCGLARPLADEPDSESSFSIEFEALENSFEEGNDEAGCGLDAGQMIAEDEELKRPALQEAEGLLVELMKLLETTESPSSFFETAISGMLDVTGGLVQATAESDEDLIQKSLAIVQLKRALRGHSFARGAVFGLSSDEAITSETRQYFHDTLDSLLTAIQTELAAAWSE